MALLLHIFLPVLAEKIFGEVTRSPHQQHQGNKKIGLQARDFVWDMDDAAFKIDLPNGTYAATNYFCSTDGAAHEVNLLANGKQMIKKLIVATGNEITERTHAVMVTKKHLTPMIYTTKRRVSPEGMQNRWLWNGCRVEQLSVTEDKSENDTQSHTGREKWLMPILGLILWYIANDTTRVRNIHPPIGVIRHTVENIESNLI